jgi:hypothetical protein
VPVQWYAVREVVRGGEQCGRGVAFFEVVDDGAAVVDPDGRRGHANRGERLAEEEQAVRLHGDRAGAGEDAAEDLDGVPGARADHDRVRCGAHATHPAQVLRECLAEFDRTTGIAHAQRLVGCAGERAPGRGQPCGPRELGDVGRARQQVVRRDAGNAPRPRGMRRRAAVDHPGARALARGEPALGDQLRVGLRDGVAGQSEIRGEGS